MKKMIIFAYIVILITACNKSNKQAIDEIPDDNNVYVSVDEIIDDENIEISAEMDIQKYFDKTMYVNSPEGLRVRNLPSIDGERIGLLDFLAEVKIITEDNISVTIDGIEGKWVKIITPIEGWVFSGYLDDEIEEIDFGDNVFQGKYRFHAFEIIPNVTFATSFDLSLFDKLDKNIYINITWKEGNTYLLETNFWLLIESIEAFNENHPMEIKYPFDNPYISYKEGRLYAQWADGHNGGRRLEIYFFENKNEIVIEYDNLNNRRNIFIDCKMYFKK
jgi:hypothetical protein